MAAPAPRLVSPAYEERRVEELRRWKRRANGFLVGALVVFLLSHWMGGDEGIGGFVRAASEAALIGGIADWFAVTALFRHPLGLPIPHTALIPRSKDEIGRNLGEFVHQNFLDPAALSEWLHQAGVARRAAAWLEGNASLVARRTLAAAAEVARSVDEEQLAKAVTDVSLEWARQTPAAPLLSVLLDASLRGGRHDEMIEAGLRSVDVLIEENLDVLRERFAAASPWWLPAAFEEAVFHRIVGSLRMLLEEVAADRDHPLREDIEARLGRLAVALRDEPEVAARVESAKSRILDTPEVSAWLLSQWGVIREALVRSSEEPGSGLQARLAELIAWWAARVRDDTELSDRIDRWIAESAGRLAGMWEEDVTGLIEATVDRWDAGEVARRLELQLGRDLQFVRINGTVVGGLVGTLIHAILVLFG